MAAYIIGSMMVKNTAWREEYTYPTAELLKKYGGKILTPFGSTVESLEGDEKIPDTIVILEFPSVEQARAWHQDPEYAPLITMRQTGTDGDFVLVKPL